MKRASIIIALAIGIVAMGIYSVSPRVDEPYVIQAVDVKKPVVLNGLSVATFAGGCFWCVESAFEAAPGVRKAISGFSGGDRADPSYNQVALGLTKHTEAVQVYYDPTVINYEGLLHVLWHTADPTDMDGQFSDRGKQYRPAIFYHDEKQKRIALRAREELAKSNRYDDPVTIEIVAFKSFYPARERHQDYYLKHPWRYRYYTIGSGRAGFQRDIWGNELSIDFSKYRPPQTAHKNDMGSDTAGM